MTLTRQKRPAYPEPDVVIQGFQLFGGFVNLIWPLLIL